MKIYLGIGMNVIKFDGGELEQLKNTGIELPKGIIPIILDKQTFLEDTLADKPSQEVDYMIVNLTRDISTKRKKMHNEHFSSDGEQIN